MLLRAKLISSYPKGVIATLTGLTDGRLPVTGKQVAWGALSTVLDAVQRDRRRGRRRRPPQDAAASAPPAAAPGAAPAPSAAAATSRKPAKRAARCSWWT